MAEMPEAPIYPRFSIETKHLPEAKGWKIEGKYRVALDITMTGLSIDKGKNREYGRVEFNVTGIEVQKRSAGRVKRYTE